MGLIWFLRENKSEPVTLVWFLQTFFLRNLNSTNPRKTSWFGSN